MQQRHVRLSIPGTDARFGPLRGQLIDLSLSGALVELNGEIPVGDRGTLLLKKETLMLELPAHVVRIKTSPTGSPLSRRWFVGMAFDQLSNDARTALVRSLARAAQQPSLRSRPQAPRV